MFSRTYSINKYSYMCMCICVYLYLYKKSANHLTGHLTAAADKIFSYARTAVNKSLRVTSYLSLSLRYLEMIELNT